MGEKLAMAGIIAVVTAGGVLIRDAIDVLVLVSPHRPLAVV